MTTRTRRRPGRSGRDPSRPPSITPTKEADYNLLATIYASGPLWSKKVPSLLGFSPDRAVRLDSSPAGRVFCRWFLQQPKNFIDGFRIPADPPAQVAPEVEEAEVPDQPDRENTVGEKYFELASGVKPPPD